MSRSSTLGLFDFCHERIVFDQLRKRLSWVLRVLAKPIHSARGEIIKYHPIFRRRLPGHPRGRPNREIHALASLQFKPSRVNPTLNGVGIELIEGCIRMTLDLGLYPSMFGVRYSMFPILNFERRIADCGLWILRFVRSQSGSFLCSPQLPEWPNRTPPLRKHRPRQELKACNRENPFTFTLLVDHKEFTI